MRRILVAVAVAALWPGFLLAQSVGPQIEADPEAGNTRVGTRGANFLGIGIGARGLAMAGAGATLHPGVFSMYWNPSGLALVEGFDVGFSYSALYEDLDVDYFFVGGAIQFLGGVAGVSFASLSSGDIPRTSENFPVGGDPIFGPTFEWTSSFVGVYYARRITDRLRLGGGIKFIREGITDANVSYVGFDAGVGFLTGLYGIELGAALANLGTEGRFRGPLARRIVDVDEVFPPTQRNLELDFRVEEQQLPTLFRFTVRLDVSGRPESLIQAPTGHQIDLAFDVTDAVDSDAQAAVGLEYSFRQILFARAGKRFVNEEQRTGAIAREVGGDAGFFRQEDFRDFDHGLSVGGGLRFRALGRALAFDYAYVAAGELENIQVFSFEFGL